MDMHGSIRFTNSQINDTDDTRLVQFASLTSGQIVAMPNGTEIGVIDIAPLGVAASTGILQVTQEFKDRLLDPSRHEDCEHGNSPQELLDIPFPASFFFVTMPEDYVPDIADLANEKLVRRGYRDGTEGAPMLSEPSLKAKHPDDWHDEAYTVYVAAYKRGSSSRKGR